MTLGHSEAPGTSYMSCFEQRQQTSSYDVLVNVDDRRGRSLNEVRSVYRQILPWYRSSGTGPAQC